MIKTLHERKMTMPSDLNINTVERELDNLEHAINVEAHPRTKGYLCAAYQALHWARNPNGHAAPSEMRTSISRTLMPVKK